MKKFLLIGLVCFGVFIIASVARLDGLVGGILLCWMLLRAAPGMWRDLCTGWGAFRAFRFRRGVVHKHANSTL